ncbi:MAG: glycosyltransferase [Acidobacteria bacterium]|jgi:hypothetical protein|nr:glycosyltransferase [Acidobacteriota bacterium]
MNSRNTPLVSIVIPVYNGSNYLREAIDSALAQTYPQIEVLVVNDGSNDGGETAKIALAYGERIRYFAKENGGVASALNLGLREMRGAYFSWLSHDDIFLPEKTALQAETLLGGKDIAACYADYFLIDAVGAITGKVATPWLPRHEALKALFGRQYINGSTLMVRRACFDSVGLFNEELRYSQDMEMWFRLLQRYEFGRVPLPLAGWRIHPGQGSQKAGPHQKEAQTVLAQLFLELGSKGLLDDAGWTANASKRLAHRHIWFGRVVSRGRGWYGMGDTHLKKAMAIWPSAKNPARLYLLLNKLMPLYHHLQRIRVSAVHFLANLALALGWKRNRGGGA